MSSSSFGAWYETQKNERANQSISSSWNNDYWKGSSEINDVESTGLLSKVKSMKSSIFNVGTAMKEVMTFFGLALVFFAIAYFIGLPTLLVRPAKFSISFMMGSFMTIAALARLQGYDAFLNSMLQPDRILKTILYLLSLLFSILCAVVWKSYIGTMISSLLQICILVYFVCEAFPKSARFVSMIVYSIRKMFSFIQSTIRRCLCYVVFYNKHMK